MRTTGRWLTEAQQNWRGMIRRPGYLIIASFTLALGIAATTTVFSMVDQAFLRPLPFPNSESLVSLGIQGDDQASNIGSPAFFSAVRSSRSFSSVGIVQAASRQSNISFGDSVEVASTLSANEGLLGTLGLPPAMGRNFNPDESRPGGASAAIISYALWHRAFGGTEDVLGRMLRVEGSNVPVIGVLPKELAWPVAFDLILPLQLSPTDRSTATNEFIVGRLNHGVSVAQASAEVDSLMRPVLSSSTASEIEQQVIARLHFNAVALKDSVFASQASSSLWLFMAASFCVLAISAFNLSNLMIVRNLANNQELAIRAALGATTWRLAVPCLAEAALIAFIGVMLGIAVAALGLQLIGQWVPAEWLRGEAPSLGPTAAAFAVLAGIVTSTFSALVGSWRGQDRAALAMLGRRSAGMSHLTGRLTKGLIVGQVAVAVVLLLCASLFAQSLDRLSNVPMGFSSQSLVTFSLSPVKGSFPNIEDVHAQARKLQGSLAALPGIEGEADIAASTNLPTASQFNMYAEFPDGRGANVQFRPVTPEYFNIFNIPLLAGRSLSQTGRLPTAVEGVVSETFAKTYLDGDPLGKLIRVAGGDTVRVTGIVGDVRQFGPGEDAPPVLYVSLAQMSPELWQLLRDFMPLRYVVRVALGSEESFVRSLPELVRTQFADQPISEVRTMTQVVRSTTSDQRLTLTLVSVFSTLALLLAGVGLFAVMSVAVAARDHEFGVRAAMGASPAVLKRQVLREGAIQTGTGLLIGSALAAAFSKAIQKYLFGIGAADPVAIAVVILALSVAALAASAGPALRASRTQPMQALREQ